MRWSDRAVREFLDWQRLTIYGSKITNKHRLDSDFLIILWKDHVSGGNITKYFLSELYTADTNDIIFDIRSEPYVLYGQGIKYQGYFDATNKNLVSAIGCGGINQWLGVLVHETCHMDQYLNDTESWCNYDGASIDDWIAGKNFLKRRIYETIDSTQELELDCEIRTVKKIKKFQLPIDIEEYTKKANAYIFFHQFLKESRHWPEPPRTLYNDKIWQAMPAYFLPRSEYLILPDEYRKLYKKHL